jgi:hypothetical protein
MRRFPLASRRLARRLLAAARLAPFAPLAALVLALPGAAPAPPGGGPAFSDPLTIDNPFMSFHPGGVKVYTGSSEGDKLVVVDLYREDTRTFQLDGSPVECAILQETEFVNGAVDEISLNYFAQSDDGVVHYFGEVVDIYEDGAVVAHDGSWLVGGPTLPSDPPETAMASVPGVFMRAQPALGDSWKPEDLFPVVDETVTVLDADGKVQVAAGKFEHGIKVGETSQLSEGTELKWYAPGIGFARSKEKGEKLQLIASSFE